MPLPVNQRLGIAQSLRLTAAAQAQNGFGQIEQLFDVAEFHQGALQHSMRPLQRGEGLVEGSYPTDFAEAVAGPSLV